MACPCTHEDFLLSSYDYHLPPGQIAQFPPANRGESRLMVLAADAPPRHEQFVNLPELLPPRTLLIANNSRVVAARLTGTRKSGGRAEVLLLTPLPLLNIKEAQDGFRTAISNVLLKPAARLSIGDPILFSANFSCQVLEKGEYGQGKAELRWKGDLGEILEEHGALPLPPYIRRQPDISDRDRYQTIYASSQGSIAAPTAGLHFTNDLRKNLLSVGHQWAEISLHVGYGTFSPVRTEDIRDHVMHEEYAHIPQETAEAIRAAKEAGNPVIAIGTTSLRALEGVGRALGQIGAYSGMVNQFIYPGRPPRFTDGLLTNFHLPRSTLLMLVSAIMGRERTIAAYEQAVQAGYRFFSYGDAMLIY